eukprot:Phypoly_transcript_04040.p1 GENE.Phypoly_transcript_04040~~Phypoly_transcript_04040.p1  ORF type:complete len:383 (+),score=55.25 Phypoly_transcript_04040:1128-2276(+)
MGLLTWLVVPLVSLVLPFFLLHTSSPYTHAVNYVEYHPLPKYELQGVLAKNDKLSKVRHIAEGKLDGPETVTFDDYGNMYAGTADGNIMKISAKDESVEVYARVGGRPLGIDFDKHKNLVICDSLKGLISVHPETRQTTVLASHVGDSPIVYADDLAIAKSGKIYFSDANNIAPEHHKLRWEALTASVIAIISSDPIGRLLEYDPETRATKVLIDGLVFANGVSLSNDEDYVLVADTGRPSIHRYYISGPKAGQRDYFVENLPGIPDGITVAKDGRVYVCLYSMRSPFEVIHPYPLVKKFLVPLLPFIPIMPKKVGCILVLDKNGNFLETLWDTTGKIYSITHVHEHDGKLYFGSLATQFVAVYDPPQAEKGTCDENVCNKP